MSDRKPHISKWDRPGFDKWKCGYPTGRDRIFGYGYTAFDAYYDWQRRALSAAPKPGDV